MVNRNAAAEPASNHEWKQWGQTDPFFGVASWAGRERDGQTPWTPDDFYALGASDWADFRQRWLRYGVDFGRCLEIGCGAGRLTKHLAADFSEVIGVDVSEGMLQMAAEHLPEPNIDLRPSGGAVLPLEDRSVDGVFSAHVFQHFESIGLARANFREAARVLRLGGTAMIHLPVYTLPPGLEPLRWVIGGRKQIGTQRAKLKRRLGKPLMRGLVYDTAWLQSELPAIGLDDVEISTFATQSNGDPHTFVMMRRVG